MSSAYSLVTGGAGFLGSHICDALIRKRERVCVIDNLSTGNINNIRHLMDNPLFHFVNKPILEDSTIKDIIKECDIIYHFAATVGVKLVYEQPLTTILNNIRSSEFVLEMASQYGKRTLIASSSEVYGNRRGSVHRKLREDDDIHIPHGKRWCYATTKALSEHLAKAYHAENNTAIVICRLFNIVGPRQTGTFGMVLPRFVEWAVNGSPIKVYGDGKQRRCFCSVRDAVDAIVKLAALQSASGHTFNIGSDKSISITQLATKVKRITSSASEIVYIPYQKMYGPDATDVLDRVPDISKIRKFIDFEPSQDIDSIIRDIADHYAAYNARKEYR